MGSIVEKIAAGFVAFWMFANAAGHPEWAWKVVAHVQHQALKEARKPWGCPSIFSHCEWERRSR